MLAAELAKVSGGTQPPVLPKPNGPSALAATPGAEVVNVPSPATLQPSLADSPVALPLSTEPASCGTGASSQQSLERAERGHASEEAAARGSAMASLGHSESGAGLQQSQQHGQATVRARKLSSNALGPSGG